MAPVRTAGLLQTDRVSLDVATNEGVAARRVSVLWRVPIIGAPRAMSFL